MAANKIYRATWCIDGGDFASDADRNDHATAEADLVAAEAAAGSYTTFVGVVETLWIGDGL